MSMAMVAFAATDELKAGLDHHSVRPEERPLPSGRVSKAGETCASPEPFETAARKRPPQEEREAEHC
jgi:hypothetical protein